MVKGISVRIRNFEKFKGRGDVKHNSWFRCSNRLLEDPDFFDFSHEELMVWIYILAISSQKDSDTVFINFEHADRVSRLKSKVVLSAIEKLYENQIDPADVTCAIRARNVHDTSTCATDKTDRTDRTEIAPVPPPPTLVEIWNQNNGTLAKVKKTNGARNKNIAERWKENSEEEWVDIIQRIAASSFCNGKNPRGWEATFDWLLKPDTHLRVSEGKYDDKTKPNPQHEAAW